MSLGKLAWKVLLKATGVALWLLLLPLTLLLHLCGYRRVTVFADRIGHLALEPDCLLKEQALGKIRHRRWILLADERYVANTHLVKYWEMHFLVLRNRLAIYLVKSMSQWWLLRQDVSHYIRALERTQAAYRVYRDWGDRPPILALSHEDEAWSATALEQLGLPKGAWYVCVHVREAGFSAIDEELHEHRNSDIEKTVPAIQEIVRRGGWVIRIGDPSMKPLPQLHHAIDYAHHPLKSERLDIVLCAKARFMLGNTSGIALVATIFGVPCALANMVPMAALGIGPKDISIPKQYWSAKLHRHLGISEVMSSPLANTQFYKTFTEAEIRLDENEPEDIFALCVEMLDILEKRKGHEEMDTGLQDVFFGNLRNCHYSFGACSKIGHDYLRAMLGRESKA